MSSNAFNSTKLTQGKSLKTKLLRFILRKPRPAPDRLAPKSEETDPSEQYGSIRPNQLPLASETPSGDVRASSETPKDQDEINEQQSSLTSNRGSVGKIAQGGRDPDSVRTLERYEKAKDKLRSALKVRRNEWGSFELPELDRISETEEPAKLQTEVDKVLDARIKAASQTTAKGVVKQIFMALSPFAKNFLTVASSAQSVNSQM